MIIDLILDRKDGCMVDLSRSKGGMVATTSEYSPKRFYEAVMSYGVAGHEVAEAMDSGEEKDVKEALRKYIMDNEYNQNIIHYVNSVDWL